ncbi:helix-turn-helix domain-containing protein [Mesorhizobium sp. NBSH29]|uniref:ArsR/SmtB family transcription factor n=1 Tax=Mesorhizobium sp. NBSH29 TaxID=2654249 RepID=UPI0018967E5B|nr:helix-turn-helix domain-containing protein [Mesorhizobium sp. NBSH29]QPC88366.1 helix-turn-helix domain-containing protein [Mesorhizobium sp. NBSH29]
MTPAHPDLEEIDLPAVLAALSDPTRLSIVRHLSEDGEAEAMCGTFGHYGSKSNLSYHFAKLREAGVTRTRIEGPARFISLRRDDLETRFPGLLGAVIKAASGYPRLDLEKLRQE